MIDDLTIREAKKLTKMFGWSNSNESGLNDFLKGEKVIIRTYSAGVWFGTLSKKSGSEVILDDARRMWRWWCTKSISLSGVALYGLNTDKSRIAPPVGSVWLEAIEIIKCTHICIESISEAKHAEAD